MGRALKAGFMAGLGHGVQQGVKDLNDFYWKQRVMEHEEALMPLKLEALKAQVETDKLKAMMLKNRPQLSLEGENTPAQAPSNTINPAPGIGPMSGQLGVPMPMQTEQFQPEDMEALQGLAAIDDKTLMALATNPVDPKLRQQAGVAIETKRRLGARLGGVWHPLKQFDESGNMQFAPEEWKEGPTMYGEDGPVASRIGPSGVPESTGVKLGNAPGESEKKAQAYIRGFGASPEKIGAQRFAELVSRYMDLGELPADQKSIQMAQFQDEVRGLAATPRSAVEAEAVAAGVAQGRRIGESAAKDVVASDLRNKEDVQKQARKRLQTVQGALAVIGKLEDLLGDIGLPETGSGLGGRLGASPALLGQKLSQSNPSVAQYESLAKGAVFSFAKALGNTGTPSDKDMAKAQALIPRVTPGEGGLPDTREVANRKLNQLRQVMSAISGRLAAESGQALPVELPDGETPKPETSSKSKLKILSIVPIPEGR